MANKRINQDRVSSNLENQHRFQDKIASIDSGLDEALSKINWERRNEAEKDLPLWIKTYCLGILLEDEPPPKGNEILSQMQNALTAHNNYMICMSRGSGKSSYVICATIFALATGLQKFVCIISNSSRSANSLMNDIWRLVSDPNSTFAQDYPEVSLPFTISKGSFRRRQLYRGKSTQLEKNATNLVLPTLYYDDGNEFKTSSSIVTVRGISSGIRGLKHGKLRPSLVILDDLQTSEIAENPLAVQKLLNTIKKDIFPLGGKERLSILQTATPICPNDLVAKIKEDKNWQTTIYPAIIKFPINKNLWKEYFKIFDTESIEGNKHNGSLDFYKKNRKEMDEGSEVFNPTRFSLKDGHISALQKMMEIKHIIGESAFASEYQMQPKEISFAINLTPKMVVSKTGKTQKFEIPDGYTFCCASTDLNLSYCLTTSIIAFKPDMSATVIGHIFTKSNIDSKLTNSEYSAQVYKALSNLGKQLQELDIKIDGWGIDGSGTPFDIVCEFTKHSNDICGIPSIAMLGRANHIFNPFVKSRLRNEINKTILCGNPEEHIKSGSGYKYIFWNSDYYRALVQKGFVAEIGQSGGIELYQAEDKDEHTDYAIQVCNEKLIYIRHSQTGKDYYEWQSKEPHDCLDSTAQGFAIAASQGINGIVSTQANEIKSKRNINKMIRRKIKIV